MDSNRGGGFRLSVGEIVEESFRPTVLEESPSEDIFCWSDMVYESMIMGKAQSAVIRCYQRLLSGMADLYQRQVILILAIPRFGIAVYKYENYQYLS